jgi:GDPmannose 4,6-dehydratase
MWMMLQQEKPDDFIIATGESHSILEFIEHTFDYLELDWKKYVISDPKYFRPSEVDYLQGNATKARTILGWKPRTNFIQLIKIMVDSDLKLAKQELLSNQV